MPRYKLGHCNLPEILEKLGMSNQEFADKMGMKRQLAWDYINGKKKMGAAVIFSVADTLDISDRAIYDLEEVPIKKPKSRARRLQKSNDESTE
jgi:transcriptional regulator with XRE-family HTH domain